MTLFKYLPPGRVDVLEKLQIRFSPAISTNDAFELKPLLKGWASREAADNALRNELRKYLQADSPEAMLRLAVAKRPEMEPRLREDMERVGPEAWFRTMKAAIDLQFADALPAMQKLLQDTWPFAQERLFEVFGTQIGILSLTEDPTSPVMWGHYSDSSRGFVVGFDDQDPWFNRKRNEQDDFCHLRKVVYAKRECPKFLLDLTAEDIVYSKLEVWSYEREWRLVFPLIHGINTKTLDDFGQPVIVFPIPPEIVTEVVIGSRASEELSQKLRLACDKLGRHVEISIGKW